MGGGIQCILIDLFGCLKCAEVFDMIINVRRHFIESDKVIPNTVLVLSENIK